MELSRNPFDARMRRWALAWVSLLRLMPKTGRTHQIRVHLADMGYPLVGDKVYGRKRANPTVKNASWFQCGLILAAGTPCGAAEPVSSSDWSSNGILRAVGRRHPEPSANSRRLTSGASKAREINFGG